MAKTGHPNFVIKYTQPWRGINKTWRFVSNHSGATLTSGADQLTLLQAIHNEVVRAFFVLGGTVPWVIGYQYYNGSDSAALSDVTYASQSVSLAAGWLEGLGSAYNTSDTYSGGAESTVTLQAPVGLSSTSKPVFLKHFIHGVQSVTGGPSDTPDFDSTAAAAAAVKLGDGSLPFARVLCSASGRQGVWTYNPHYGNHQMTRRRRKAAASSGILSEALSLAEAAAKAALSSEG